MDQTAKDVWKTREERLIDIGAEIRKKEAEVARLRSEFQRLLGDDGQTGADSPPATFHIDLHRAASGVSEMLSGGSLPKRLLAQMQACPDTKFRAEDFIGIGLTGDVQSVRTSLARLCDRDGLIERTARGEYMFRQRKTLQTELPVAQAAK